jgi:hypothetical protein
LDQLEKIELVRKLLNNGASMNMSKDILLRLSKKVDQYIVDYYKKVQGEEKVHKDMGE